MLVLAKILELIELIALLDDQKQTQMEKVTYTILMAKLELAVKWNIFSI